MKFLIKCTIVVMFLNSAITLAESGNKNPKDLARKTIDLKRTELENLRNELDIAMDELANLQIESEKAHKRGNNQLIENTKAVSYYALGSTPFLTLAHIANSAIYETDVKKIKKGTQIISLIAAISGITVYVTEVHLNDEELDTILDLINLKKSEIFILLRQIDNELKRLKNIPQIR